MVAKKIVIVANSDLTFDQRLQRIAGVLSDAGYMVEITGRLFQNSIELKQAPYTQSRISLWFRKGKLSYLELNIRLVFGLMLKKYDALCSVDLDTLPACWLMKKARGKKLIHDAHEYMEEVPEVYNRPVTRWIWKQIALHALPAADLCYTVSHSIAEAFESRYGIRFAVIRNIASLQSDPEHEKWGETGYWVFLGAVNKGRGLEEFLDVLPFTNRKLVIVGDGDVMQAVRQKVKHLRLEDQVVFMGKQRPEVARNILRNAWAGINLLTDEGLSYRYSLANKFFDYVHAGIPQICISFPEYQKLNSEYEVALLTPLTHKALQASVEIISQPEIQAKLRNSTEIAKQTWNWQTESQFLLKLYAGLFLNPS